MRVKTGLNATRAPGRDLCYSPVLLLSAVAVVLLILGLILFRDFVFGGKTLLYKDVGADSLNIFYPNYVLHSEYLRHYGLFSWAFETGMGQNISPTLGSLVLTPVIWLPKHAIATALVYQHFFYVVVGGLFFFCFLRGCRLAPESCFLGAALFAFSSYMCMGSCWYFHAAEAVAFAILLFSADRAIRSNRWFYLTAGVAATSLLGAFHLYLAAVFLCLFVPARLFLDQVPTRQLPRALLLLALAAVLGIGLNAFCTIDGFSTILNSPRGSGPTSLSSTLRSAPVFALESAAHYTTAILRLYANDLAGTGVNYRGDLNYLEAPMSYCGLICLLLVPQSFLRRSFRQRLVFGGLIGFLIIPTLFPWFRHLFWAFQGEYYRTLSLFGIFGVVTLAMVALSDYCRQSRFSMPLLLLTTAVLAVILYLPLAELEAMVDPVLRRGIVALLIGYSALLCAGRLLRRQGLFCWLIILVTIGELLWLDRLTIDRPVVTKHELTERVGYNDHTVEAVAEMKATESGFFRLTKTFGSSPAMYQGLNDALVFGYYGTTSYSSFNNLNYIQFLIAVGTIAPEDLKTFTHWSVGLVGHPLLLTFAGEKYVLTEDPVPYQTAGPYEPFGRYGQYYAFRNNLFLPLGLAFSRYVPETMFLSLAPNERAETLLRAVVLPQSDNLRGQLSQLGADQITNHFEAEPLADTIQQRRAAGLRLHDFSESHFSGELRTAAPSVLVLQMPFDSGWHARVDGKNIKPVRVDCGLCGVFVGSAGDHEVRLWYTPPYRFIGACISVLSFAILFLAWLRRNRGRAIP